MMKGITKAAMDIEGQIVDVLPWKLKHLRLRLNNMRTSVIVILNCLNG